MKVPTVIICYIVVALMGINYTYSQQLDDIEENEPQLIISTPYEARDMALDYLGFDKMEGFSVDSNFDTASLVIIDDDKTPYLHYKINNREIWKVVFKGIQLKYDKRLPETNRIIRTFDVYIDPISEGLLKIESIFMGENRDFTPAPSIDRAERQLTESKSEYVDFVAPDSNYVSFYDAINNASPLDFKEVTAHSIILSSANLKYPIPVWSVTFRGIRRDSDKTSVVQHLPFWPLDHTRFVYDAVTGELLFATSIPSPDSTQNK